MSLIEKYRLPHKDVLRVIKKSALNLYVNYPKATTIGAIILLVVLTSTIGSTFKFFSHGFFKNENVLGAIISFGRPHIDSVSANSGAPTDLITLRGTNLGVPKGLNAPFTYPARILFSVSPDDKPSLDATEALPVAWSDKEVALFIPPKAKSGKIFLVYTEGDKISYSNGVDFEVNELSPKISSISPDSGTPSNLISIKGVDFGAQMVGNPQFSNPPSSRFPGKVLFGNEEGVISSWLDQEITLFVPNRAKSDSLEIIMDGPNGEIRSGKANFLVVSPEPKINSLSTKSGFATETVIISGGGFGNLMTSFRDGLIYPGKIYFDDVEAIPSSWDNKNISAFIPTQASLGVRNIRVDRYFGNKLVSSSKVPFTITKPNPQIGKVTPEAASPSNIIILEGSGFGNEIRTEKFGTVIPGQILFGSVVGSSIPGGWSDNKILAYVPSQAQSGPLSIILNSGKVESNKVRFVLSNPNPKISSISPKAFTPGQVITIKGSGFGGQMINSTAVTIYPGEVFFGDKKAIPVLGSWAIDTILVFAPFNATTGQLRVQLDSFSGSVSSNKVSYEIQIPQPKVAKIEITSSAGRNILVVHGEGFNESVSNPSVGKQYPGSIVISADGTKDRVGRERIWLAPLTWTQKSIVTILPKNVSGLVYVEMIYKDSVIYSNGAEMPSR